MKKILKRILIGTVLTTVISFASIATLILYPQLLFAEKTVYKDFNIYSNNQLPDTYKSAIDYAIEVIKTSEIYESGHQLDIFLCHGTFYNDFDTKLLGFAMAKSLHDNILLKVPVDFDKNILIGWNSERNLKKTIAHEAIHFYQMNKYGMTRFSPITHPPTWKGEGYPEYVAYQKDLKSDDYDLIDSITKIKEFEKTGEYWFETEPGQLDPFVYYKGRVMIEYLIDIKGLTYTEILDENLTEENVIAEMTLWYEGQKSKE
jgi:hypothetical protein